jgi:predicted MPP superfamily phosphohydrolase
MRLLLIQLSDWHLEAHNRQILGLVDPIVLAAAETMNPDSVVLLALTGDLAFSGKDTQYALAAEFVQEIRLKFLNELGHEVRVIALPGNHDCDFDSEVASRKLLIPSLKGEAVVDESVVSICTAVQKNFRAFVTNVRGDAGTAVVNDLLSVTRIGGGNEAVAIWQCNSAWTSQLQERPGTLWFPVKQLQAAIEDANPAFNVLLLHHPLPWFQTDVRRALQSISDSAFNMILGGHEHIAESWVREDLEGSRSVIVEGGVLHEHGGDFTRSSFNIVEIDFSANRVNVNALDLAGKRYNVRDTKATSFDNLRAQTKPHRRIRATTLAELKASGATFRHPSKSTSLELDDIFVEPELIDLESANNNSSVPKTIRSRDAISPQSDGVRGLLGGSEKAGKSAWLRWAFLQLHAKGLTPVRIDGVDLRSPRPDRLLKSISRAYEDQYEVQDAASWSAMAVTDRVLLIDDLDNSPLGAEDLEAVLNVLKMHFATVLATCGDTFILETSGVGLSAIDFRRYQLPEFGHRLRDELVGKWLKLGQTETLQRAAFQVKREVRVRHLNALLGKNFVPSRPIFLLTLLQSMELGADAAVKGSSLGQYYEFLIRHALLTAKILVEDLDAVLNYLTELAYNIVSGDRTHLEQGEFLQFNANFARRYDLNLRYDALYRQLRSADILEQWDERVRFKYRYVLLFFGAKYLADKFGRDELVNRQVVALGKHLSAAKYADLMLFVVHHSNDPAVLDIVLREAEAAFRSTVPLTLDIDEVAGINALVEEVPRLALREGGGDRRREERLRAQDAVERARQPADADDRRAALSLSTLADEQIAQALDFAQQTAYAMRLLAILGQVLRNYYGSLLAERKEEIASIGYQLLARLTRAQLDALVESRDWLVARVTDELSRSGALTRERAESSAKRMIFGFCSMVLTVCIKKASEFLGSDKLLLTHDRVSTNVNSPLSKLLGLAVVLDYPESGPNGLPRPVPMDIVREMDEMFRRNLCGAWVLRRLILEYLYMFDVSHEDKQRICDTLGIPISKQEQIRLMSRHRKGGIGADKTGE